MVIKWLFCWFSENNSDFNCLINLADEFATGSFKVASLGFVRL